MLQEEWELTAEELALTPCLGELLVLQLGTFTVFLIRDRVMYLIYCGRPYRSPMNFLDMCMITVPHLPSSFIGTESIALYAEHVGQSQTWD